MEGGSRSGSESEHESNNIPANIPVINPTLQQYEEFFKIDPTQPTFPDDMDPADIPVINPTQQQFEEFFKIVPTQPTFPADMDPNPYQFEYPTQEEHQEQQFQAPDFLQFAQQEFDTHEFEEFFTIDPTKPTFPADMDPADTPMIDPYPDRINDDESYRRRAAICRRMLPMMYKDQPNEPRETKCMDVRGLCEDALGYVRSKMGLDYEFVDVSSQLVSSYSRAYGYGLHFNFFARQKNAPRHYQAELFFVEVAFGNPVRVIHCAPVVNQPYYLGDAGRPPRSVIFHPNHEYCFNCDLAKNRTNEKGFFLAPPLP